MIVVSDTTPIISKRLRWTTESFWIYFKERQDWILGKVKQSYTLMKMVSIF